MSPLETGSVVCPMCKAENTRGASQCFLCDHSLSGATELVPPKPSAGPTAEWQPMSRTTAIMLLIVLMAICAGVFQVAPGIAVPVAVIGTIALIGTLAGAGDRRTRRPSVFDHVAVFLGALVAIVLVAIAAVAAFFVTCLVVVSGTNDGSAGLMIGGIAAVAVIVGAIALFVIWRTQTRSR
jgi:hypothetical protein